MVNLKHILFFILFFAVVLHVSASDTCTPLLASTSPPGRLTKVDLLYPTDIPVQVQYYQSTSGEIQVDASWCSSDASLTATFQKLFANVTQEVDSVMVYLGMHNSNTQKSPATRLTGSLVLLLSALSASLFFFPKSRLSGVLVLSGLCIALCAAADNNTVTIRIGLPSQITTVCENGKCSPWPKTPTAQPTPNPNNITGLNPTNVPTSAPTNAPTDGPTSAPTTGSPTTGSPTTGSPTTGSPTTGTPTNPPSDAPTNAPSSAPTNPPTDAPTDAPTSAPTTSPAALHFNLKVLILSDKVPQGYTVVLGADFAQLAFSSVGMPFDYVVMDNSVDLSTYLTTTGTGKYSGIVSVYDIQGVDPLTSTQNTLIRKYQKKYGVKWVIVGRRDTTGLNGISAEPFISGQHFQVTFASQFAQYGKFLNQSISVNTQTTINWSPWQTFACSLVPVTITDYSTVTPAMMAHSSSGSTTVAAAAFKMADGTEQLNYFLQQGADYIHSMAFASVMVNWISPGGLFIGARRLSFSVQPDDLFLGSYVWDTKTHSNPVGANATFYRISAGDLQLLADNMDALNAALPTGSYVTVEWPTNFGGVKNLYYTNGQYDYLYDKAVQLIDKFYYLSHTWDHPCPGAPQDFDNTNTADGFTLANMELSKNIDYAPQFFGSKQHLWSANSMITPCVTGLYNGGVLRAMSENNIHACVSDESVGPNTIDYEPITPYHGVYSTVSTNGFDGIYFVPRTTLDIDYSARTPEDVVDQYNSQHESGNATTVTFEQLMAIERMYALGQKISFRHDPFMLHQTNAANFRYHDPTPDTRFSFGSSYNTSLVALYMQRVLGDMMSYYNLPIVSPQMDDLVEMFQQRQFMDACGITATLGVNSDGQIVDLSVTNTATCKMSLSGGVVLQASNVKMETYGVETTAMIDLTSAGTQSFTISPAIPL